VGRVRRPASLIGADQHTAPPWIGQPINAVLLSLLLIAALIHLNTRCRW
jgi:succinate dehydrogenase hydrophobic anchor subunit